MKKIRKNLNFILRKNNEKIETITIFIMAAFARVRNDDVINNEIISIFIKKLNFCLRTKRVIIPTTAEYIVSDPNVDGYLSNPDLDALSTKKFKGP